MLGRILCLLGLHDKVLARAEGGPTASDVYYCRCARPTCKWSRPDADLPRNRPQAAVPAIVRGKVRI